MSWISFSTSAKLAYSILDEMIMCDGSIIETSKEEILNTVDAMDSIESSDDLDRVLS